MKKTASIVLFVAVLFTSCTDPLDRKISKETLQEDAMAIKKKYGASYTNEDWEKLGSVVFAKILQEGFGFKNDITYRAALDSIKYRRLRYEYVVKEMKGIINATITKAKSRKGDYGLNDYFDLGYTVYNKSGKDITAFKATISVKTQDGTNLINLEVENNNDIKAGKSINGGGSYPVFENVLQLKETPVDKLKFIWKPELIILENGETMKIEDVDKN